MTGLIVGNAVFNKYKIGIAYGLKLENGNLCDLDEIINTVLKKGEFVWVLMKGKNKFVLIVYLF